MENGIVFLIDSAAGVYVPQWFVEKFNMEKWGVKVEDAVILVDGPDSEFYWDVWHDVLGSATFTDENGHIFQLYQDGDLFAYCPALMTPVEQINFFGEYNPPDNVTVFYIGEHFASLHEYGETEGLTEDEIVDYENFMKREKPDCPHHWTIEPALSEEFGTCEITGIKGNLIGLLLVDMR